MNRETAIKLFEDKSVRVHWDQDQEKWYFSIIDIIGVLTESANPRKYWSVMKTRLKNEGSEVATNCSRLKLLASDGKMRQTDVANTEQLLRLIQSIPSPKAEPFKIWLAKVGYERIEVRKELTDEWDIRGVKKGSEYAILTDEITKAWTGMTTREYKKYKNLKKENLRDNMTNLELVLNMLAEASTSEISKEKKPKTLDDSKKIAHKGGKVADAARKQLEKDTGKNVVSPHNAKELGTRIQNDGEAIDEKNGSM